jgi:hypothetical protein
MELAQLLQWPHGKDLQGCGSQTLPSAGCKERIQKRGNQPKRTIAQQTIGGKKTIITIIFLQGVPQGHIKSRSDFLGSGNLSSTAFFLSCGARW